MKKSTIKEMSCVQLIQKGIRLLEGTITMMVLLLFLSCIAFGMYAVWDSDQLYEEADVAKYAQYKPSGEDMRSFEELKQINPEVIGWLNVYGTNIDYPLVQGIDNETYINTSATGERVLSGSIFLDYRNQPDLSDFNNIIYGHHMSKRVMFGEIGEFQEEQYFNERPYGKMQIGEKEYGIEFFAFVEADGYDREIYTPAVTGEDRKKEYLDRLLERALYVREIENNQLDRVVLLSTCTTNATNGRHILIGQLTDTIYEDTFLKNTMIDGLGNKKSFLEKYILLLVSILLVLNIMFGRRYKRERKAREMIQESSMRRTVGAWLCVLMVCIGTTVLPMKVMAVVEGEVRFTVSQTLEVDGVVPIDGEKEFIYVLKALQSDSPLPQAREEDAYFFTLKGNQQVTLETLTFTEIGTHKYQLQLKESKEDTIFALDQEVYMITVYVTERDNTLRADIIALNKEGLKSETLSFTHIDKRVLGDDPINGGPNVNQEKPNEVGGNTGKTAGVKTGDEASRALFVRMSIVAGLVLIIVLVVRKRRADGNVYVLEEN